MRKKIQKLSSLKNPLGDFRVSVEKFHNLSEILREFSIKYFQNLNDRQKNARVSCVLLDLIQQAKTPCFLLPAVLDYIDRVNALHIFEPYTLLHFELWLNQFSGLNEEDNLCVRGKITGKWIPRDAYQILFPIGMGKMYPGSHFVTAHGSPDLDTTVASFWGWMDAFSARVGKNLNLWNIPGGPPVSQPEIQFLFSEIFGQTVFQHLAKTRTTLALSGIDLITQKGVIRTNIETSMTTIDHERNQAVVLVDERGYYLGDWRSVDVEIVRQVIALLNNVLRWFETHLHLTLISLLAKDKVSVKDLPDFIDALLLTEIGLCEPVRDCSEQQKRHLDSYLKKVLGVHQGLEGTFQSFAHAMKDLCLFEFQEFIDLLHSLPKLAIFDRLGMLIENRPRLFHLLERIITSLKKAIQSVRTYVDRLDVALKIKTHVFAYMPHSVSARAEVEEMRSKMANYSYLTVTVADDNGRLIPLGIISASDLHKTTLGTVTLRDFCNRDETKIPSYFEIISVIDHHKSHFQTTSAPMVMISDAQSSNVLCAELAFQINDRFSCAGMTHAQMEKQLKTVQQHLAISSNKRIFQRLLNRLLTFENTGNFFIHPTREYLEYLHFLYAILDDTDLLTKVSCRDLECVAEMLNRLKSLTLGREVEIITLCDLPRDEHFLSRAAQRILQHSDMYSLYSKIYLQREEAIEDNIKLCARNKPSSLFIDTKTQNGCVHVGQTKLFGRNFATFAKHASKMRQIWYESSLAFLRDHAEIDLYLHMISTIVGAKDVYAGSDAAYTHCDELWIWLPFTEPSIEHLKIFLNAFRFCPQVIDNALSAEFYGKSANAYEQIFTESFLSIPMKICADKKVVPIAILKYRAGSINSRKAMISPYLPKVVT